MEILAAFFNALYEQGPLGILAAAGMFGWVVVAFLISKQHKRKDESGKLRELHIKENKKIHDEYHKKLDELNVRNAAVIIDITNKRVEDIMSLTDDYSELASNTLQTLDRLIYQLEIRKNSNGSSNHNKEGKNDK